MKNAAFLLLLLISFPALAQDWGSVDGNAVTIRQIAPLWPGCESNDASKINACFTQKLNEHIQKNFRYPPNAWKNNVQERVVVKFIINTKGEVEIKSVEGKNKELVDEAKRNILAIPKMKPGMMGGKPTPTEYTVPFNFKTGK